VFVQRSIRLCATASANLLGGTTIVAVESLPARWEVSHRLGADHVGDFRDTDAGGPTGGLRQRPSAYVAASQRARLEA
jgi:threonine dehydrogenase-like Zn-dependent dehydrogenase